jgi:hypothetical protein
VLRGQDGGGYLVEDALVRGPNAGFDVGDLDGNGVDDLVLVPAIEWVVIHWGNSDGTYTFDNVSTSSARSSGGPRGVQLLDVDSDGDLDVVAAWLSIDETEHGRARPRGAALNRLRGTDQQAAKARSRSSAGHGAEDRRPTGLRGRSLAALDLGRPNCASEATFLKVGSRDRRRDARAGRPRRVAVRTVDDVVRGARRRPARTRPEDVHRACRPG